MSNQPKKGKMASGPELPPEVKEQGATNMAAVTEEQRGGKGSQAARKQASGPKIRENGSYAPASYRVGKFGRRDN